MWLKFFSSLLNSFQSPTFDTAEHNTLEIFGIAVLERLGDLFATSCELALRLRPSQAFFCILFLGIAVEECCIMRAI